MERPAIEGLFLAIDRRLIDVEDLHDYCPKCFQMLRFSDDFDALYCASCNEWIEITCDDLTCEVCQSRPARPLDENGKEQHRIIDEE